MMQCGRGRQIPVVALPNKPLQLAFDKLRQEAVKKGWLASDSAQLRFMFDGEQLSGDTTVAQAGMEEDDVVDVVGI